MLNRTIATAVAIVTVYLVTEKLITFVWPPNNNNTSDKMLLRKKKLGRYTVGLTNRANDCFANSDMQALAAIPVFYEWVKALNASCSNTKQLSFAMEQMIAALNEPIMKPKSLSAWQLLLGVVEKIHRSRISRSQHDAHELLHLVLETLENELKTPEEKRSFPFRGETSDTITCCKCGYSPPSKVSGFLVLSVMVPQKKRSDLSTLLDTMTSPEIIDGYGCSNCRLMACGDQDLIAQYKDDPDKIPDGVLPPASPGSSISKRTSFHWLPSVLAIHLSRSIYYADRSGGASRNSCKVSYPEYLDVFSELLPNESTSTESDKTRVNQTENIKSESQNAVDALGVLRRSKKIYKLVAMIRHKGTHQAGHYECYRRKDFNWFAQAQEKSGETNANGSDTGEGSTRGDTPSSPSTAESHSHSNSPDSSSGHEPPNSNPSDEHLALASGGISNGISNGNGHVLPFPARSSPSISVSEGQSRAGSISSPTFTPISSYPWWRISDEKVWECGTKEVLKEESGAYLLFYQETSA